MTSAQWFLASLITLTNLSVVLDGHTTLDKFLALLLWFATLAFSFSAGKR